MDTSSVLLSLVPVIPGGRTPPNAAAAADAPLIGTYTSQPIHMSHIYHHVPANHRNEFKHKLRLMASHARHPVPGTSSCQEAGELLFADSRLFHRAQTSEPAHHHNPIKNANQQNHTRYSHNAICCAYQASPHPAACCRRCRLPQIMMTAATGKFPQIRNLCNK